MPQMTPRQARVIDPILTQVAQGHKNADFVGEALFPVVPVEQRGGKIIQFGKEDFKLYATGRAPGANTKRVNYGYQGDPYSLEQHALEGQVPFEIMEDANAVPNIDMATVAIRKTQNIIDLRLEKARADIARDEASYDNDHKVTLSGTDQWSDHDNSDPTGDIDAARSAVRSTIGRRPNTALLSGKAFDAVRNHPKIIDRIKYTGRDSITPEMLASLWNLQRVVVGDAVYAEDDGDLVDVWGGDVIVAYTEVGSLADMGLPSYGYTYRLRNFPIVEQPYQDRNAKSWIYPVTDEVDPVMAAGLAGFLIRNAA
ncbi:conserved hypothetical protein [Thioalkalivibrio sulfidiphilus HL-EbGr7]|uniref:Phage major capsid protein E n=1 Tax=Thioalkalivibrio sulfidiphilus (strain HL-EbGR7) TaxID=396588 RepID=B8GUY6_THISH|nr:major capsid protein [Thioalkalivibrio sulfidiphilus]ACL71497.1 conserved hypothetical protein [Thioalkalivibrio sulfidiphilus HL-EbGr7]